MRTSTGTRTSTRRAFLGQGAAVTLIGPILGGASGSSDLRIGQIRTSSNWSPRPNGLRRLLWEVTQRTSIEVDLNVVPVDPLDGSFFRYPFLYWSGSGGFSELSDEAVRKIRRHLTYGGTLLVDSADAEPGGAFDLAIRREMRRILPRERFATIPSDHVIYKSFFLVDYQAGRAIRVPYLEGITLENRLTVVYCQNDLAGAWSRDAFGRYDYEVTPGGERQREMAFRLGINIVMYALCLDYKDDQVHAPFIVKRRR